MRRISGFLLFLSLIICCAAGIILLRANTTFVPSMDNLEARADVPNDCDRALWSCDQPRHVKVPEDCIEGFGGVRWYPVTPKRDTPVCIGFATDIRPYLEKNPEHCTPLAIDHDKWNECLNRDWTDCAERGWLPNQKGIQIISKLEVMQAAEWTPTPYTNVPITVKEMCQLIKRY